MMHCKALVCIGNGTNTHTIAEIYQAEVRTLSAGIKEHSDRKKRGTNIGSNLYYQMKNIYLHFEKKGRSLVSSQFYWKFIAAQLPRAEMTSGQKRLDFSSILCTLRSLASDETEVRKVLDLFLSHSDNLIESNSWGFICPMKYISNQQWGVDLKIERLHVIHTNFSRRIIYEDMTRGSCRRLFYGVQPKCDIRWVRSCDTDNDLRGTLAVDSRMYSYFTYDVGGEETPCPEIGDNNDTSSENRVVSNISPVRFPPGSSVWYYVCGGNSFYKCVVSEAFSNGMLKIFPDGGDPKQECITVHENDSHLAFGYKCPVAVFPYNFRGTALKGRVLFCKRTSAMFLYTIEISKRGNRIQTLKDISGGQVVHGASIETQDQEEFDDSSAISLDEDNTTEEDDDVTVPLDVSSRRRLKDPLFDSSSSESEFSSDEEVETSCTTTVPSPKQQTEEEKEGGSDGPWFLRYRERLERDPAQVNGHRRSMDEMERIAEEAYRIAMGDESPRC